MNLRLPRPNSAPLGRDGQFTREWYDYLRSIGLEAAPEGLQAQIDAIRAELDALIAEGWPTISGPLSVQALGSLADGSVTVQLRGDSPNPGPSCYYGTNDAGAKGFHELPPGGVPYFIPAGATFRVPEFLQSLFAMAIDCEGYLDVEGYLIEVD